MAPALAMVSFGCDVPSDREAVRSDLPFDTRPAGGGSDAPHAEGGSGVLGYANGCLFLTQPAGGKLGLVMPDSFRFDGKVLTDGDAEFRLGEHAAFSGGFTDARSVGSFCREMAMLIVDNAVPPAPPPDAN